MKSGCELCRKMARIRCEADQARLCWDCDSKVHSANFLVARHSRNLLCRVCQSQTPWSACGASLPYAVAICRECAAEGRFGEEDDVQEEVEVEENQVVPWSPPPAESCSISQEAVSGGGDVAISRKRARIVDDPPSRASDRVHECSSSHRTNHTARRVREATVAAAADPYKRITSPPQKISKSGVSDSPSRLYRVTGKERARVLSTGTSNVEQLPYNRRSQSLGLLLAVDL